MKEIHKKKREIYLGIATSFLLGIPILGVIAILVNVHSNRMLTTLIILFLFIIMESIPVIKQKRNKVYRAQFLSGFVGGIFFLTLAFWLVVINVNIDSF